MKRLSLLLTLVLGLAAAGAARAQTAPVASNARPAASAVPADTLLVEASCGQCRLGLPGKGCDLAVRLPSGRAYFVAGTGIDAHGDAHAKDGFCNAVRQARVLGRVVAGKFDVRYFQLVPEPTAAAAKPTP